MSNPPPAFNPYTESWKHLSVAGVLSAATLNVLGTSASLRLFPSTATRFAGCVVTWLATYQLTKPLAVQAMEDARVSSDIDRRHAEWVAEENRRSVEKFEALMAPLRKHASVGSS